MIAVVVGLLFLAASLTAIIYKLRKQFAPEQQVTELQQKNQGETDVENGAEASPAQNNDKELDSPAVAHESMEHIYCSESKLVPPAHQTFETAVGSFAQSFEDKTTKQADANQ